MLQGPTAATGDAEGLPRIGELEKVKGEKLRPTLLKEVAAWLETLNPAAELNAMPGCCLPGNPTGDYCRQRAPVGSLRKPT